MREVDLLIIGAGPAGLAAANEAKVIGLAPVVIDENPLETAWFRRQVPVFFGDRAAGSANVDSEVVYRWMNKKSLLAAAEAGIEVLPQHACWGIFRQLHADSFEPATVGVHHAGETSLWSAKQLILAGGTSEIGLAFEGWELGGVLGGLGALRLFSTFGYLEAKRMVILGSGALAQWVAKEALTRGIEVAALVEIEDRPAADPAELQASGVEVITGHTILRAEGRGEVERVVLTGVSAGQPSGRADRIIEADTLCVAIGATAAHELPFMARCTFEFDRILGGPYPAHSAEMRTSRPNILVAGDAAGTPAMQPCGWTVAGAQGRIAAISAAESLGVISAADAAPRRAAVEVPPLPVIPTSSQADSPYLTSWHRVADLLMGDGVYLCRCEQVSRGTVLRAGTYVSGGYPDEVKRFSRAGMGICQGRLCRAPIAGTIAAAAGRPIDLQPLAAWRAPLRPIPIAALATEELTTFDLENELEPGAWIDWWFLGNYVPREHKHGAFAVGESLG